MALGVMCCLLIVVAIVGESMMMRRHDDEESARDNYAASPIDEPRSTFSTHRFVIFELCVI